MRPGRSRPSCAASGCAAWRPSAAPRRTPATVRASTCCCRPSPQRWWPRRSRAAFSAHIRRAVGEQEVLDPKGLRLELLGGVTLRQTADGVEILAGEKKLLKTGQNYAIIKQEACDAVLSPNGIWLREGPGMGVFDTLQQNPVLKIEWQATSV